MGVILEGEEIERGYTRWPKATHRGRRPPAREASVPPAGTRRRAAERLELLVLHISKKLTWTLSLKFSVIEQASKCLSSSTSIHPFSGERKVSSLYFDRNF